MTLLCYDEIWVREPRLMVPRQKPVGSVRLDPEHPLRQYVVLALPFTPKTGFIDLVSGRPMTNTGSTALSVLNGRFAAVFSGSQALSTPAALTLSAESELTVIYSVCATAWATSAGQYNFMYEYGASAANNGCFGSWNDGSVEKLAVVHTGNVGMTAHGRIERYDLNTWHHTTHVYDYKLDADYETKWFDGVSEPAYTLTAASNNSGLYSNQTLYIGARTASSLWFFGGIEYLYLLKKALTLTERSDVYRDPYQFLIPA